MPPNAAQPSVNGTAQTPPPKEGHIPAKQFGSLAATGPTTGASSSTAPSPTPSNVSSVATSSAPAPRRKLDPNKFFQNQAQQQPAPSPSTVQPAPTSANATSFPPPTHPQNSSLAPNPAVNSPSQRFTALPPPAHYHSPQTQNAQVPQYLRPNATGGGPRSPSFSRGMALSGVPPPANANGGPRPGGSQQGGPPQQVQPGQVGSPRMAGQPPLPMPQPHQAPQPQQPPPGSQPGQPQYPHMPPAPGWQQPYPNWVRSEDSVT